MSERSSYLIYLDQFRTILTKIDPAIKFIKKNKIWQGLLKYKWMVWLLVFFAVVVSSRMIHVVYTWAKGLFSGNEPVTLYQSMSSLYTGFESVGKDLFLESSFKYIILVLLEFIIFHCAVVTLNILRKENQMPTLADFIQAQKRMIVVALRSWGMEMILTIVISMVIGIFGFDFIKSTAVFVVQAYYMGFLLMDNYNEQFGIEIKESAAVIKKYAGASVALGILMYLMMLVPIVGSIAGPIIAAVVASLYMHEQGIHKLVDRHISSTHDEQEDTLETV